MKHNIDRNMSALRKIKVDDLLSVPRNFIADGKAHVLTCPKCYKDNYPTHVSEGACAWCQWSAYR